MWLPCKLGCQCDGGSDILCPCPHPYPGSEELVHSAAGQLLAGNPWVGHQEDFTSWREFTSSWEQMCPEADQSWVTNVHLTIWDWSTPELPEGLEVACMLAWFSFSLPSSFFPSHYRYCSSVCLCSINIQVILCKHPSCYFYQGLLPGNSILYSFCGRKSLEAGNGTWMLTFSGLPSGVM